MSRITAFSSLLASAALLVELPSAAQQLPQTPIPDASQVLMPPSTPAPVAPQAPETGEQELNLPSTVPGAARYHFAAVRIVGAEAVDAARIAALFKPLEGRDISAAELKTALDKVNGLYLSAGYPLGRAFVPAQVIRQDTLIVRVVEGYVGTLSVLSDDARTKALVERIAHRVTADRPLRAATLERTMLLIKDLPGVTSGSQFRNMNPQTGATTLVITARLKSKSAMFYVDNRSNLDALPFQPYLTGALNNMFGWGDQISLTTLLSPRQKDYAFYRLGLSRWVGTDGLTMGVMGSWARARDEINASTLDIRSETSQFSYDVRYPWLRSTKENLSTSGKLYYLNAAYNISGTTIAKDDLLAVQFGADYVRSFSNDLGLAANFQVAHGLGDVGAGGKPHTRLGAEADFMKIRTEGRLVYRPLERLSLIFRAKGQYSADSLFSSEEIAFGGLEYGRGFDASEAAGDSGIGLSFQPEYTIPLDWGQGWSFKPYLLTDYAKTYNTSGDQQPDGELFSAGIGTQLAMAGWATVTLEMDKPINRPPFQRGDKDARFYAGFELQLDRALSAISSIAENR